MPPYGTIQVLAIGSNLRMAGLAMDLLESVETKRETMLHRLGRRKRDKIVRLVAHVRRVNNHDNRSFGSTIPANAVQCAVQKAMEYLRY